MRTRADAFYGVPEGKWHQGYLYFRCTSSLILHVQLWIYWRSGIDSEHFYEVPSVPNRAMIRK
jgi:hypothetical protein